MNVVGFKPHKGQLKVINGFVKNDTKYGVVICGRQYGKSLLGINSLLYWLLNNNQTKGCWISPIYKQCRKIFDEMVNACEGVIEEKNKSELTITFLNGSTLQFLSSERPDSIRGFSFHYMVIDEAGFITETAINEAIVPTLTALGRKCLVISTPKGKNWLYDWYLRGTTDNPRYVSFRGISTDNPYTDLDFIEECRKSFPKSVFEQEFEAKFTDSGNDVFKELENGCILDGKTIYRGGGRYFGGIDVGVSNDYCVCVIMDDRGRVCDFYRDTNRTFEHYANNIIRLLREYKCRGVNLEVNGVGYGLYELIRKQTKIQKWNTTNENKQLGIQNLIYGLEEGILELPSKRWDENFFNEFSAYTYRQTANGKLQFNAPSGYHDDCVMATMLANEARRLSGVKGNIYVGRKMR